MRSFRSVLLWGLLSLLPVVAVAEYFDITHYQVDIEVHESNVYSVVETIDVSFHDKRHGIYRTIPSRHNDRPVLIKDIQVADFESVVVDLGDEVEVRIGSADCFVDGEVSYSISYLYDVGADGCTNYDEFYHNVIGTEWDVPIESVDFTIVMPKPFNGEEVNCTSGAYGSTATSNVEWVVEGAAIKGRILSPLNRHEGVTVALPLPEGYWVGAEEHLDPMVYFPSWLGYPFYFGAVLLAFVIWLFKGRDNRLFKPVEFSPPDDLTPAEIGYLVDESIDDMDMSSMILYWADKGYLHLKEDRGELVLTKRRNLPGGVPKFERTLFRGMFPNKEKMVKIRTLYRRYYKTISKAKSQMRDDIGVRALGGAGSVVSIVFRVLSVAPLLMALIHGFSVASGSVVFATFIAIPFFLFVYFAAGIFAGSIVDKGRRSIFMSIHSFGFVGGGSILPCLVFYGCDQLTLSEYFTALFCSIIILMIRLLMGKRTAYGDQILGRILGFKDFINLAERERLEKLFDSDPSCFYHILPYALVLGLSRKWCEHFEGISVSAPIWYSSSSGASFTASSFKSSFNKTFATLNSTLNSTPPSSSGGGSSSSGGSSGGGSGGGGGGSW